jgi:hypothetical protein
MGLCCWPARHLAAAAGVTTPGVTMSNRIAMIASSFLLAFSIGHAQAAPADDKGYTEGPVTDVAFLRIKDGKLSDYMKHLNGTYKALMEAQKKAGLITDWKVYAATPRTPQDANLILTTTYPNYAALDKVAESEAITAKVEGSLKASDKNFADRSNIREVLGSELLRELILK